MTETDVLSPREIVTRLHAEIAAISPDHAALVAEYNRLPRGLPVACARARRPAGIRSAARLRRLTVYTGERLSGTDMKAAARKAGVARNLARQYEADMLAVLGGEVQ